MMHGPAIRSYLKATEYARKARQLKLAGCTKLAAKAIEEARWHSARARSLATD